MALTKLTTKSITGDTLDAGDLAANSVDSSELVDGSIDTSHIGALQVTTAKLAADAVDSTKLADDAVGAEHIADNAVGLAALASGTDGNIISYDASGNPVAISTGNSGQLLQSAGAGQPPAFATVAGFDVTSITGATALAAQPNPDDDEFVISDNGTLKRLDYKWLTNRNYFFAYLDGAHTVANSTTTKLEMDAVKDFGDGSSTAGLDTTNKRLVPTYPGYYFFAAGCRLQHNGAGNNLEIKLQKNGNEIGASSSYHASYNTTTVTSMDYMNGSSDYIELFLNQNTGDTRTVSHYSQYTYLLGFRLSGH